MISPAQQKIIQIELTNACPYKCSNCTRFTSHVRRPFFMDFSTFCRAVDSLVDFPGMVGIMGGEPTIHPDFEDFVAYYANQIGPPSRSRLAREPIKNFNRHRNAQLSDVRVKRGLWTSLGKKYYEHYELIQEVFNYQCINDHGNRGLHQALLISRESLGIPDDQWIRLRDQCWVQNLWSAAVNPKGAFFCEVAAALDILFDGPGGWPIEPGWWKRTPDEFGDQLQWCELCSAPLQVPRRRANERVDDVCPINLQRLKGIDSPAIRSRRVSIFSPTNYKPEGYECRPHHEWYLPDARGNEQRISGTNRSIYPRRLDGLIVCVGYNQFLEYTLPLNVKHFEKLVVVTTSWDRATQGTARKYGAELVVSDRCYQNGDSFNKGRLLNDGFQALAPRGWVLLTDADIFLPPELSGRVKSTVLNPGCLYYTRRLNLPAEGWGEAVQRYVADRASIDWLTFEDPSTNNMPWGYFQLFNVRARALRGLDGAIFSEAFCSAGSVDEHFQHRWPKDKRICIAEPDGSLDIVHFCHGSLGAGWNSIPPRDIPVRWRFAGQVVPSGLRIMHEWPHPCYLRLSRIDTAEAVILATDETERWFVLAGHDFGVAHCGFYCSGHEVAPVPPQGDRIVIAKVDDRQYSGWGMGHKRANRRQGFVWDGVEIRQTNFELSFAPTITEAERELLILQEPWRGKNGVGTRRGTTLPITQHPAGCCQRTRPWVRDT